MTVLRLRAFTAVQAVDASALLELPPAPLSSRRGSELVAAPMLSRAVKLLEHVRTRSSPGVLRRPKPKSLRDLRALVRRGVYSIDPFLSDVLNTSFRIDEKKQAFSSLRPTERVIFFP